MDLSGTELVVLSACQTGEGQQILNEGIYGMHRAFALAGSRAQVVTLWRVSSEPTKDLVVELMDELDRNRSRSQALQAAQRKLAAPAGGRRHPHHWAGFVLVGDRGPLQRPASAR